MEISNRLQKIVDMMDTIGSGVDVGTDHAYVPIQVMKEKKAEKFIASDINKGPLEKAQNNIVANNMQDRIECRLGGGLSTVTPGEVDVAVISGMGGNLIKDIIEADKEVFKKLDYAILQPTQNPEVVREYIYKQGYEIIEEELTLCEGIYYEYIKVKYAEEKVKTDEIYYEIGIDLIENNHPLLDQYIDYKIDKYANILGHIQGESEQINERREEVLKKIDKLQGIKWMLGD